MKILGGKQFNVEDHAVGMGFDKLKIKIKSKAELNKSNPHKIEGYQDLIEIK